MIQVGDVAYRRLVSIVIVLNKKVDVPGQNIIIPLVKKMTHVTNNH
jgi:hypothetical protein